MNIPAAFSKNQYNYLQKTFTHWLNVAEGGKRGGKNVLQCMAFALNLENHPDRLHCIAGVTQSTASINILDCNGFGLLNYFKGRCREGEHLKRGALFVQTAVGEKIILIAGIGKKR